MTYPDNDLVRDVSGYKILPVVVVVVVVVVVAMGVQ